MYVWILCGTVNSFNHVWYNEIFLSSLFFFCVWSLTNKENEMKECRLGGQRSGNVVRVGILKDEMAVEVPLKPNHQST